MTTDRTFSVDDLRIIQAALEARARYLVSRIARWGVDASDGRKPLARVNRLIGEVEQALHRIPAGMSAGTPEFDPHDQDDLRAIETALAMRSVSLHKALEAAQQPALASLTSDDVRATIGAEMRRAWDRTSTVGLLVNAKVVHAARRARDGIGVGPGEPAAIN